MKHTEKFEDYTSQFKAFFNQVSSRITEIS